MLIQVLLSFQTFRQWEKTLHVTDHIDWGFAQPQAEKGTDPSLF